MHLTLWWSYRRWLWCQFERCCLTGGFNPSGMSMYVCMYVCLYPPQLLMSLPRSASFFSTTVPVQKYNYRINKIWMKETGNMEEKCNKSFNERWATQVEVMWRYCASSWRKTLPSRWAGPSTTGTLEQQHKCFVIYKFVKVLVDLPGAGLPVSADRHWALHSGHLAWCLGALWWFIPG